MFTPKNSFKTGSDKIVTPLIKPYSHGNPSEIISQMVPSSLADNTTTRARYMKVFAEDEIACLKTELATRVKPVSQD